MFPVPAKPPLMSEYVAGTVPELSSRYISAGELSHKIQFTKLGLELSLHQIPPPLLDEFPVIVTFAKLGLELLVQAIPPPLIDVEFPQKISQHQLE